MEYAGQPSGAGYGSALDGPAAALFGAQPGFREGLSRARRYSSPGLLAVVLVCLALAALSTVSRGMAREQAAAAAAAPAVSARPASTDKVQKSVLILAAPGELAAAVQPEPAAGASAAGAIAAAAHARPADAAAAAKAADEARAAAREQAIKEVDRPFDVEFDDDFEDDDALPLPGRRERTQKRRPGVITFDEGAGADR